MNKISPDSDSVRHAYNKEAPRYDRFVGLFDLFRVFGFDILAWRAAAVQALDLKPGDTVVDIGCGTGLNFPLILEAIGHEGRIIGVDLSDGMLNQADQRVTKNGWKNVELVHSDAVLFDFPQSVEGVLSTFAMILIPGCDQVVRSACEALSPGRRLCILDMVWPAEWPEWFRHILFFLRSYGVTGETIRRQPWKTVWGTMEGHLGGFTKKHFWMGAMYLAWGVKGSKSRIKQDLMPISGPGADEYPM